MKDLDRFWERYGFRDLDPEEEPWTVALENRIPNEPTDPVTLAEIFIYHGYTEANS